MSGERDRRTTPLIFFARAVLLLGVCLVVGACGGADPTIAPVEDPTTLVAALEDAGAQAQLVERPGPAFLHLMPQSLLIGGEQLWVYSSQEPLETSSVSTALAGEHFVWANEHLIVRYSGTDGGTILLLDGLLGEALIRPDVAGDEPYPPAIPAAIRAVAAETGAQPMEIEVVEYAMVQWGDTCLDLGKSGESCDEQTVPGWRVTLRHSEIDFTVHTDLLGEDVRWSLP